MKPEQVMKRCQIGTRSHDEANNLHAECYGTIGSMLNWIESEGERNDTCTKAVTGNVCRGCRCQHKPVPNQKGK